MEKINTKIAELLELLKTETSAETTSCNIFINCQGSTVKFSQHSPLELRRDGVSMRNIKGEWIK